MPRFGISSVTEARRNGTHAALREHGRLGTDLSKRIDIFDIIERSGIWLMFQPLKDLYGAYDREGEAAGIIINGNHPLSLQRFTAAHEYGHHVLGHRTSLDHEVHIQPSGNKRLEPREIEAQVFASHFLMPLKLVNTVLRHMNLPLQPGTLEPQQAYLLALEIGVSYAAAVTHLAAIGKITSEAAQQLRRWQPKKIKMEIGRGARPLDAWADIWPIEQQDSGKRLYPRINDEIYLSLPETPSTGYVWVVATPAMIDLRREATGAEGASEPLAFVSDKFEPRGQAGDEIRIGAGGTRHFVFRILQPGYQTLRLTKLRPWDTPGKGLEFFEVHLEATPQQTGDSENGLSQQQKPLLALAA